MADRTTHAIGPRRLLLIGMMGSGKSTLGRALEQRLGWPYLDNDRILEAATGSSARELLAAGGERALRTGEGAALRYACATRPPAIAGIAAPGMPAGSPGMETPGETAPAYEVLTFDRSGQTRLFAKHGGR